MRLKKLDGARPGGAGGRPARGHGGAAPRPPRGRPTPLPAPQAAVPLLNSTPCCSQRLSVFQHPITHPTTYSR